MLAVVVVAASFGACEQPPDGLVEPDCFVDENCDGTDLCVDGACVAAPQCLGVDDWPFCKEAVEKLLPGRGRTAMCLFDDATERDAHCHIGCEADDACAEGSLCTDFGNCVPGLRRTPTGTPRGTHSTLQAGVGEAVLDIPATASLGGLASRGGPGDGDWAAGLDASVGHLESLWARAAVLDAGDGRALIVRLPVIFPGSALTEAIAAKLEAVTGDDWRDALVVSTTHNHSGPARFVPILAEAESVLGPFGVGTFRQEIFDRFVDAASAAALQAIDRQQPARLGWDIVEAYDVDDTVTGDRRGESPPFDDNRALLIRVDDDAGLPLFVITGFGIHPTENSSNWATNDVVGGVERALEGALFPVANRVVPVLFVNGNGGSQSSAAGGRGFAVPHGNDATGAAVVDALLPALLAIETNADIAVSARAHRFHVTTPLLGYTPGEWSNPGGPPFGGEVTYGGLNCFSNVPEDVEPYDAALTRETMDCGIPFHTFLFNHPPSIFQRTQISALQIDGLSLLTLPGELTMELGWGIAAQLQRAHGVDPLALYTMGYANDHLMYLLPTSLNEDAPPWPGYTGPAPRSYPPQAFSPLRGGFEADTSIFGDRMGDYLIAESMTAWRRLLDHTPSSIEVAPAVYTPDLKPPIAVTETSGRAGVVVVDLPATVARRAPALFTFVGGDVAIDGHGPIVTLVHDDDGTALLLPSGRPWSTDHAQFPLGVKRIAGEWQWTAYLELPADLPAGSYRLEVVGRAKRGDAVIAYVTQSAVFSVSPATLLVTAERDGADVVVSVGFETETPLIEDGRLFGRLLLVDTRVRSGAVAPAAVVAANVVIRGTALVASSMQEVVVGDGFAAQARIIGVPGAAFDVDVVDAFGNVGTVAVTAAP